MKRRVRFPRRKPDVYETALKALSSVFDCLRDQPFINIESCIPCRRCHWLLREIQLMPGYEPVFRYCPSCQLWEVVHKDRTSVFYSKICDPAFRK